jgi:hypothetical protein
MMLEPENLSKVWYDPKVRGYRLYDKNGNEIKPTMEADVSIFDNWGNHSNNGAKMPATVKITMLAEVVNEEPKPHGEH